MAGCILIDQLIINIESGGRSRLSTLFARCFLILLILAVYDFVKLIPVVALVAIMTMVSISTFNFLSIKDFRSNLVIFVTVLFVVATHDSAQRGFWSLS